jgi:DNA polymerase III subunit delta'
MSNSPTLTSWQQAAWHAFAARRRSGDVAHALLLTASPGLGLSTFAQAIRTSLLCVKPLADGHACGVCRSCTARLSGTHPDDYVIAPEEGKVSIGIDAIRGLSERLSKTPQAGGFQVALIEPAHGMTVAAANALLKTLEEPATQTVLVLVSEQPGRLMPTILSRCQRLHLRRPTADVALTWLQQSTRAKPELAQLALSIAGQAPLLAAELLSSQAVESYQTLSRALEQGEQAGAIDALAIGKQWQQKLAEFARLYEYYLLTRLRSASATTKQLGAAASAKVLRLGALHMQLAKMRDWTGTGIRIDLAIAELLEAHVAPLH